MKLTIKELKELKNKRKITMASCFGYYEAKAMEEANIDVLGCAEGLLNILVKGDLNETEFSIEDSILSLRGVRRGAPNTLIYTVPPVGYHFLDIDDTLRMAARLMAAGSDIIRIQGNGVHIDKIKKLTMEGIPTAGHLGLMPEFTTWTGGFKCQGKKADEAIRIYEDILRVQDAGGVWVELECVPWKIAEEITKRVEILIIGIGSGPGCDGEVQVHLDTLGIHDGHYPKHSKIYYNYYKDIIKIYKKYREEVISNQFPSKNNSFEVEESEFEKFLNKIDKK